MASMTESVGELPMANGPGVAKDVWLLDSIRKVHEWVERNEYCGYDTFDGLSSRLLRPLTFENPFLLTVLQQGVRRFPINLRPLLGVPKGHSTKAMGFFARGFIRLHKATGEKVWAEKARVALDWLMAHPSPGYSGACWGNHFDYVSRSFYLPKGKPTVVWTALIGHAFLDGYQHFQDDRYLQIAVSACEHILRDLELAADPNGGRCISYIPGQLCMVHNANVLGGSFLARTYALTSEERYRTVARDAMQYTAQYQRPDGSWYYGEKANLHWVDNFHTGYVLDCFKHYGDSTGDESFAAPTRRGYEYWKRTFFLEDGTPRYYDHKTLPIDIQCSSQAIDTLVFFAAGDPEAASLATRVAQWTIANMQDPTGYFYYRKYSKGIVNKTPTLHWGQATMLCALAGLYQLLPATGGNQ